jgi:hypothetical protein
MIDVCFASLQLYSHVQTGEAEADISMTCREPSRRREHEIPVNSASPFWKMGKSLNEQPMDEPLSQIPSLVKTSCASRKPPTQ